MARTHASEVTTVLRSLLRRADRLVAPVFPFDEVRRWPPGACDLLTRLGVICEPESIYTVPCDGCAEGHLLDVDVRQCPVGNIGVAKCPECGRVEVSLDRLRQWSFGFDGLARAVADSVRATGELETLVLDRLLIIGAVSEGRIRRDVFLGRGLTWTDADELLRSTTRFRNASKPILLVPALAPTMNACAELGISVLALADVVQLHKRRIHVDRRAVLYQSPPPMSRDDGVGVDTVALADVDSAVLQELAKRPHKSMLIEDIVANSGFGKTATKLAIKRLKEAGLIGLPSGAKRRGVAITEPGLGLARRTGISAPTGVGDGDQRGPDLPRRPGSARRRGERTEVGGSG